ncbi:MAG: hypothetical protein OXE50_10095 [Chloroflexi bacterium]|nr:hypothetical protein [Chloroflexota bacterium]
MNVEKLQPKTTIGLADGSLCEVVEVSSDNSQVKVRYIDTMGQPQLVGTEGLVDADEILTVIEGTHAEGLA